MKNAPILLFGFLTLSLAGITQRSLPAFGKIDIADLQMSECSFEPDAPAMKLFDLQETEFEFMTYGARLKTERRVRIKIFNEKGYQHASIRIPYFNKKWAAKIKNLKGIVYNLDPSGKITTHKLDEDDFYKEKAVEHLGIVNFTFPGLRPGSVIEFSYTKLERNILQMDPWLIQDEIPVAYSSHIITTPIESQISEKAYGIDSINRVVDLLGSYNNRRRSTYFKENTPSFKDEPFMSSRKDNLIKVIYLIFPRASPMYVGSATSDIVWKTVGSQMLRSSYYKEQVGKPIPGTEKIIDSAKALTTLSDRVNFVFEAVKKRMANKVEQSFNADDLKDAWNTQTGTSAAINLILLNMLVNADVDAHPLLISTRENGKVKKDFPSFGQMNGIDVVIFHSTGYYILDGSLPHQSFQTPPLNILNREALALVPNNVRWIKVTDDRPLLKQSVTVFADLTEEGNMEGTASAQHFDYAKSIRLDSSFDESQVSRERFFDRKTTGLKIISVKQDNATNPIEPLYETTDFVFQPQQTEKFYFFNPQFLTTRIENPFLQARRNYDIDLGCNQEYILTMEIGLPASFEVDHVPKNTILRMPDSSIYFQRRVTHDAGRIYLSQLFGIKRPAYDKDEYPGIQDFFKRLHALMAEEIVLRRK